MLLNPIHVQTHVNSVSEHSNAVSFNSKKSKIDPDEAIPSVINPLEKPSIPADICMVLTTHMHRW